MNYLDDFRRTPWLLSTPVSRHIKREEEEDTSELYPFIPAAVWGRFSRERKYIIIKMEEKFLDSAAEFLEKNFFVNDILCDGVDLMWEQAAIDYYKDLMKYWLRDRTSLIAIEEGNERLVGVIIGRIMNIKSKVSLDVDFSRICICNQRVQEIQDLRVNMRKEILKVTSLERAEERCFEIKLICVDEVELIARDIEKNLIKCIYVMASDAKVPLLIATMTSLHGQMLLEAEGFKQAFAAKYEDLRKRDYILFPSKEPESSVIGYYRFLEGTFLYPLDEVESSPISPDQLQEESVSEGSFSDPEQEISRLIDVYYSSSESEDSCSEESESSTTDGIRSETTSETPKSEEHIEEEEEENIDDLDADFFSEFFGQ